MSGYRLLINGQLVHGNGEIPVINPATGQVFAAAPRADEAILNRAVAAAAAAAPGWASLSVSHRAALLGKVANAMEAASPDLERLMTLEQGKPLHISRLEIARGVATLRAFSQMSLEPLLLRGDLGNRIVQQRTPLGVVAAITPWNFPIFLLMIKVGPALIAGNTMVIKPAPTTPLTTLRFGELCANLLPPGVLNVIADQNDLGVPLTRHPDVAKVSFTGSTATGRKVMENASPTLKRLTLELGGNDAAIVLPDADVERVATSLFGASMLNSGQVCLAPKRVYVPEALYGSICDSLAAMADAALVDDGLRPGTQYGPVQNHAQFNRVNGLIDEAFARGRVIAGGMPMGRPGYFIRPTIVRDIPDDTRLVREEQFGPVLPVLSYRELDDAVARANDSPFGLTATVWGQDLDLAYEVASRLEVGTVWVNKHLDQPFDVPFGGAKQSGIGVEFGREGLEEYTQLKIVNMGEHQNVGAHHMAA